MKIKAILVLVSVFLTISVSAQENNLWSLKQCIEYAKENNIQVRSQIITKQSLDADLEQVKAQQYPTLNFSTNHSISFRNTSSYNEYMEQEGNTSFQGSYSLNSSYSIYQGGKIRNTIKQQNLLNTASVYDVEQSKLDIEISVTQAYLQILYNNEALKVNVHAEELSKVQLDRANEMYKAGSISKADLSQLQSQYASDKYQVVNAENVLSSSKLTLKQLLELGINEEFDVEFPEISDNKVSTVIPSLTEVYSVALIDLPQVKSSLLNVEASSLAVAVAKGSYYPTISLSAGVSTGMYSGTGVGFIDQLNNKLNESIGLSLSIPIFNNKQVRTNVTKAKLQNESIKLQNESTNKQLLSTLESLHNDATSSQIQYYAACEQLSAAEISYEIVSEQFNAGIKNTVELISEKNNLISALSNKIQTKYQAVLSLKLLKLYQNQPIDITK